MKVSFSLACKQAHQSFQNFFIPSATGIISREHFKPTRRKEKVVFVMGATGTGKSRLSIDLANRFSSEIVNSDKMQVYKGLDIVTNKVTQEEQQGIPHHLLGVINPDADFSSGDFRRQASLAVESIVDRNLLPIIVGGSNSFIEALVEDDDLLFRSKYDCCFLWVDVALPVLHSFVSDRVDRMVEAGLVDEVRMMFKPHADYSRGIWRAIGMPEMDRFLRAELDGVDDEPTRTGLLLAGLDKIKSNTSRLAWRQLSKIHRLRDLLGWYIHRLDATEVFLKSGGDVDVAWEKQVVGPATAIVWSFLQQRHEDANRTIGMKTIPVPISTASIGFATAVAAATR